MENRAPRPGEFVPKEFSHFLESQPPFFLCSGADVFEQSFNLFIINTLDPFSQASVLFSQPTQVCSLLGLPQLGAVFFSGLAQPFVSVCVCVFTCLPVLLLSLMPPSWLGGKESACQSMQEMQQRRCQFSPWVGKISWRRKWQPTPVF